MGAGLSRWTGELRLRRPAFLLAFPAVLVLSACTLPDTESFRAPTADVLFRPLSVTNYREKVLPPVAAEDLVDASGRCAGAFVPAGSEPAAAQGSVTLPEAGVPMIPSAIALDMTECDVVKRAGVAQRVEIGGSGPAGRTVTMTYQTGDRAGVYTFAEGRLKSMERGPDLAPPPKVAKKPAKKPAPPKQRTAVQ
jgi:hypothetical protein